MSLDGVLLFNHTTLFSRYSHLWRLFLFLRFAMQKKPQTFGLRLPLLPAAPLLKKRLNRLPKITINRDGDAQNNDGMDDVPLINTRFDFGFLLRAN